MHFVLFQALSTPVHCEESNTMTQITRPEIRKQHTEAIYAGPPIRRFHSV